MLRELHISGLGVIDDLDLELHPGLNVLTGETGTGKTMIATGLALALGARGGAGLVRDGATASRVEARFDAPVDDQGWADDWAEDGEVILARAVDPNGKGRARISGRLATTSALAELGSSLVEIHGQRHAERLRSAPTQTAFLDRSAGPGHLETLDRYRVEWDRWRSLAEELAELRDADRQRERELDLLSFQVGEIESVAPRPGETDELVTQESRLGSVERLIETGSRVEDALSGEPSIGDGLRDVTVALRDAAELDPSVRRTAERAAVLTVELDELGRDVRAWTASLEADPERLAEIRERVAALRSLQRKYGDTDHDVLAFLEDAARRAALLSGAAERLHELEAETVVAWASVCDLAEALTAGRRKAAPRLARAIENELRELGMPDAAVTVDLVTRKAGATGAEDAELWLAADSGQPARPLAKTASGGELSRAMLACRSVLADADDVPTLVFDEVDAGIGGEAGLAVGRRLARLAEVRQVVVVTHLPQIACFADRHVRVEKRGGRATIHVLDDEQRLHELSRMLAGLTDSRGAVNHAAELLTTARSAGSTPR